MCKVYYTLESNAEKKNWNRRKWKNWVSIRLNPRHMFLVSKIHTAKITRPLLVTAVCRPSRFFAEMGLFFRIYPTDGVSDIIRYDSWSYSLNIFVCLQTFRSPKDQKIESLETHSYDDKTESLRRRTQTTSAPIRRIENFGQRSHLTEERRRKFSTGVLIAYCRTFYFKILSFNFMFHLLPCRNLWLQNMKRLWNTSPRERNITKRRRRSLNLTKRKKLRRHRQRHRSRQLKNRLPKLRKKRLL